MATRTIVTSQPDVACDVCERRLLRGENHDVFLAAGRRRTVCELCAPRATHQGWMRESEVQGVTLPPTRPRRGRSLFTRLRALRSDGDTAGEQVAKGPAESGSYEPAGAGAYEPVEAAGYEPAGAGGDELGAHAVSEPAGARAQPVPARPFDHGEGLAGGRGGPDGRVHEQVGDTGADPAGALHREAPALEAALAVFNSSEHPRRVSGVTRSLGPPVVNVASAEHARSVIRVVIAWELCWYRYQVDVDDFDAAVEVIAQGTELSELERHERHGNAAADSAGLLSLA